MRLGIFLFPSYSFRRSNILISKKLEVFVEKLQASKHDSLITLEGTFTKKKTLIHGYTINLNILIRKPHFHPRIEPLFEFILEDYVINLPYSL